MLIFHEGLPGSGKSYEAMTHHVLPALQKGRKVHAFIDGLNHERVAECAQLPIERVRELLLPLTEDDLKRLPEVITPNSLVVLDEAQNYWPASREKLSPAMMKFITEHRHLGLDILLMGQLMKDVHTIWRGRVGQLVIFNKLDAIGAEKRYSITVKKPTSPGKFEVTNRSVGKYDESMFGMYASHVDDSVNKENYKDKRATVWGGFAMRYGAVAVVALLIFGGVYLWRFFHPKPAEQAVSKPAPTPSAQSASAPERPKERQSAPSTLAEAMKQWNGKYRPRVDVASWSVGGKKFMRGVVEWYDGDERVQERQTFEQLERQGIQVVVADGSALIGGVLMTAWRPLDPPKRPYGADLTNGQPATTSGKAGLP